MSWEVQDWAKKAGMSHKLTPTERFVFICLADHCHNDKGLHIYPSVGTLAEETGYEPKTIRRTIARLLEIGLIVYGDQSAANSIRADKRPNVYNIVMDRTKRKLNLSGVGKMPQQKKKWRAPWDRKPKPAPVDNSPKRPDIESPATGHTGGHSVHQSFKSPKTNPVQPPADAVPASPEVIDYEAGLRLRREIRARREAKRGVPIPVPAL